MSEHSEVKRLYKSRTDRMIDGVCGGFAQFFDLDSTLVRIAWVLLTLLGGSGILLYIAAMILMPSAPMKAGETTPRSSSRSDHKFWGFLLIALGIVFLAGNLGLSIWRHWWGVSWDVILPLILILAGVAFLFGGRNSLTQSGTEPAAPGDEATAPSGGSSSARKMYRSRAERKLFGVCGGIGEYLSIDPTIVRLLFVVSAFASFGITILLYLVMAIVVPEERLVSQVN